jgi:hypothetical protein
VAGFKTLLRRDWIMGVTAEIRTGYHPNTSQKRYRMMQLALSKNPSTIILNYFIINLKKGGDIVKW